MKTHILTSKPFRIHLFLNLEFWKQIKMFIYRVYLQHYVILIRNLEDFYV